MYKNYTFQILRVMKLTTLLLLATLLQVSAATFAQKVTLKEKNAPLETVLREFRKQTGYDFYFDQQTIKKAKPVTLNLNRVSLEEALKQTLANQSLDYSIQDQTVIIRDKAATPVIPVTINGSVRDSLKKPLVGATITIKGGKATLSDDYGQFTLSAQTGDVITVSFVGYRPLSFSVTENMPFQAIVLYELSSKLNEVVINTGYQTLKPNEINGSVSVVTNEMLNQQTGTNILQRLNGVTSGIYFNINKTAGQSKNFISVRGLSTINGNGDPLIVVDNFIYEGDITTINPSEVESITILKDAAASSIWGARASNGVIVITTKRGVFNQKIKVDVSAVVTSTQKQDANYLPKIGVSDYLDVEQFLFNKGFFNTTITNTSSRPPLSPGVEIFLKRRNGQITAADSLTQINALKQYNLNDQINKFFYQSPLTQQYFVTLRGGSNNVAWNMSGGLDRSAGALRDKNQRLTFKFGNSIKVSSRLQADVDVAYANTRTQSGIGTTDIRVNNRVVPYLQVADANGNSVPYYLYRNSFIDTLGKGKFMDWHYYALDEYKHSNTVATLNNFTANVGLTAKLLAGLTATGRYQYQRQWTVSEKLSDLDSYYARDLINSFSALNYTTGIINYIVPKGAIRQFIQLNQSAQNGRFQLNYNHSWKDHQFTALLGSEIREVRTDGTGSTYYGYIADPLSYVAVDFRNRYRTNISGATALIAGAPNLQPTLVSRFVSLYANASYVFKERYSLSASGRRDASNSFGVSTNDKWNPLWSLGAGWDITKEDFFKTKVINYLKLRTSFGYGGNVLLGRYALPVAGTSTDLFTNYPYQRIGTLANPSLRWERTGQLNLGVDFGLWQDRLSGSIDVYRKKSTDLFGQAPLDYTAWGGADNIQKNVANMLGHGMDIALRSRNLTGTVGWNSTALVNFNSNKVTTYYTDASATLFTLVSASGNAIAPAVGKPAFALAAFRWGGLNNAGDPQGYLNGKLSTDYNAITNASAIKGDTSTSITYIGPSSPTAFGSLINQFNYKGFELAVNIGYRFGYYFRKPYFSSNALVGSGDGSAEYNDRWQKPGDEAHTNVPAFQYTNYPQSGARDVFYQLSAVNVLPADNIRLQYVNLAYTRQLRKLPIQSFTVFVNASNLAILWKKANTPYDPDYPTSQGYLHNYSIGFRATLQ
ncbi:MAG: SusC/RagA family TonB-linked outer membrane protein [Bacteroidota bacterium]